MEKDYYKLPDGRYISYYELANNPQYSTRNEETWYDVHPSYVINNVDKIDWYDNGVLLDKNQIKDRFGHLQSVLIRKLPTGVPIKPVLLYKWVDANGNAYSKEISKLLELLYSNKLNGIEPTIPAFYQPELGSEGNPIDIGELEVVYLLTDEQKKKIEDNKQLKFEELEAKREKAHYDWLNSSKGEFTLNLPATMNFISQQALKDAGFNFADRYFTGAGYDPVFYKNMRALDDRYNALSLGLLAPSLMFGGSTVLPTLKFLGSALTPSTYTTLLGLPLWVGTGANLLTSGYFLQDAAKKIYEDPTNLWNWGLGALSLIPTTRSGTSLGALPGLIGKNVSKVSSKAGHNYLMNAFNHEAKALNLFGMTGDVQLLPKANHLYSLYDNVDTFNSDKLYPFGYAPLDDSVDLLNSRTTHRFDEFRKRVDEVYNNMTDEEKRVHDKVVDILAEPDIKTRRAMASTLTAQELLIWKDMNISGKFNPYFKTPKNTTLNLKDVIDNLPIFMDPNLWDNAASGRTPIGFYLKEGPDLLLQFKDVLAHELVHSRYFPTEIIPKHTYVNPNGDPGLEYLFVRKNGTESSARGALLKNYFGISDDSEITEDMWEYAKKYYVQDTEVDNLMTKWFNSVINVPEFLKWLNRHSLMITGAAAGASNLTR